MRNRCTITLKSGPAESAVTLSIQGKVDEEATAELDRWLHDAREARMTIYIDLSEVTLIDREAARHLSKDLPDVTYVNCPGYIRRWIGETSNER